MVIDFHTHLGLFSPAGSESIVEHVAALRGMGVDKAAVSSVDALLSSCTDHRKANDDLVRTLKGYEEMYYSFAVVNPLFGRAACDEVRRAVEVLGMRGLKLHPWLQGFSVSQEYMHPVIETCVDLDVPVLFHDGTPPYGTPFQIADLARRYPEAKIVLGHSGLNDLWKNALKAALKYENVYLCLCGPPMLALQRIAERVPADRLLFGSDFMGRNEGTLAYRLQKIFRLRISEEDRAQILSGTAVRMMHEA